MSTILFNSIVFGPIHSRRLGTSLGVNLLPQNGKVCNFDCLYCECGFNKNGKADTMLPSKEIVISSISSSLEQISKAGQIIDSITFSGNGEPTIHPDFGEIIEHTVALRNRYLPTTKISVLTNGSRIHIDSVKNALKIIDNPIIKLDSAKDSTASFIDRPQFPYSVKSVIEKLKPFSGNFVLQTMFLKGTFDGVFFDNTTQEELCGWYDFINKTHPREIMIYTIDRETPASMLEKIDNDTLNSIARPLVEKGYNIIIAG